MEKGKEEKRKCRTLIKRRCLLGLRRWKEEEEGEGEGEKYRLAKCAVSSGRERERWEKVASVDSTCTHTICSLL